MEDAGRFSNPNSIEESKIVDVEIPNLPPEIIEEILKRLPVKSLLKFRCVSKSWLHLISSPKFIKTHLKFSATDPNFTNHIMMSSIPFDLKQSSVHSWLPELESSTVASDTDVPTKGHWTVGCCNGIICLAEGDFDIFLWNPRLRKSKKLPPLSMDTKEWFNYTWGFGYNECDDDYKVVAFYENSGVKMYSLNSDSWRKIEDFRDGVLFKDLGKYASGKLYFSGTSIDCRWRIVTLDLKSETYGMVELPDYREDSDSDSQSRYSKLGVLGGCICVIRNCLSIWGDVWVLKEDDSWSKVFSIPYVNDPNSKIYYSNPLLVLPSTGEVFLELAEWCGVAFNKYIAIYNPKDKSFRRPEILDHSFAVYICIESLVSL